MGGVDLAHFPRIAEPNQQAAGLQPPRDLCIHHRQIIDRHRLLRYQPVHLTVNIALFQRLELSVIIGKVMSNFLAAPELTWRSASKETS